MSSSLKLGDVSGHPDTLIRNVLEGACAWNDFHGRRGGRQHGLLRREGDWGICDVTGCHQRVRTNEDGALILEIAESSIGGTKSQPLVVALSHNSGA